jgi:hypothetical protein
MGLSCIIDSLVDFERFWTATVFSGTVGVAPLSSIFASFSWTFGTAPLSSIFASFSWIFGVAPLSSIFILVFCFFSLGTLALSPYLMVFFLGFLFLQDQNKFVVANLAQ